MRRRKCNYEATEGFIGIYIYIGISGLYKDDRGLHRLDGHAGIDPKNSAACETTPRILPNPHALIRHVAWVLTFADYVISTTKAKRATSCQTREL